MVNLPHLPGKVGVILQVFFLVFYELYANNLVINLYQIKMPEKVFNCKLKNL